MQDKCSFQTGIDRRRTRMWHHFLHQANAERVLCKNEFVFAEIILQKRHRWSHQRCRRKGRSSEVWTRWRLGLSAARWDRKWNLKCAHTVEKRWFAASTNVISLHFSCPKLLMTWVTWLQSISSMWINRRFTLDISISVTSPPQFSFLMDSIWKWIMGK